MPMYIASISTGHRMYSRTLCGKQAIYDANQAQFSFATYSFWCLPQPFHTSSSIFFISSQGIYKLHPPTFAHFLCSDWPAIRQSLCFCHNSIMTFPSSAVAIHNYLVVRTILLSIFENSFNLRSGGSPDNLCMTCPSLLFLHLPWSSSAEPCNLSVYPSSMMPSTTVHVFQISRGAARHMVGTSFLYSFFMASPAYLFQCLGQLFTSDALEYGLSCFLHKLDIHLTRMYSGHWNNILWLYVSLHRSLIYIWSHLGWSGESSCHVCAPTLFLPAVLTQPCYLQCIMLSHLQLCLVFHYRCPWCGRVPASP